MFGIIISVVLLGISLAMDAFAVSICDGLIYQQEQKRKIAVIPLTFGLFQAIMPVIGFYIGNAILQYIEAFDHWIAFAILLFIGCKMIWDGAKEIRSKSEELQVKKFSIVAVLVQGIATSIDALAVGFSFNTVLNGVNNIQAWAWISVFIIGLITFCISSAGVIIGLKVGKIFRKKASIAEIIGGVVLILIAVKIVLEAYGVIGF